MAPDDWIPVGAAAGYIDEPVERLFKLLEQGTIESEIPGRGVSRNSCDLWLANQKVRHNEAVEVTIHPEERESPPAKRRQGPKPPKGYISVSRAAKLLDKHPRTVRSLVYEGKLRYIQERPRAPIFVLKAEVLSLKSGLAPAESPVEIPDRESDEDQWVPADEAVRILGGRVKPGTLLRWKARGILRARLRKVLGKRRPENGYYVPDLIRLRDNPNWEGCVDEAPDQAAQPKPREDLICKVIRIIKGIGRRERGES